MKIFSCTFLVLFLLLPFNPSAQLPGSLDFTFGDNGRILTNYADSPHEYMTGVLVQEDGKIIAAGVSSFASGGDPVLTRYHKDGSLDLSFGVDGLFTRDFGNQLFYLWGYALQENGKILVSGLDNDRLILMRLKSNGKLDATFGNNGIVSPNLGTIVTSGNALAIQEDGKIVVAGYYNIGGDWSFLSLRYLPNGSPDPTFGTAGLVTTKIGAFDDNAQAVAIQEDGKILVGGVSTGTNDKAAVIRLLADGSIDSSFATNGVFTSELESFDARVFSIDLLANQKIILGARAANFATTHTDFALIQLLPNGSLDPSFGTNGVVKTNIGSASASLWSVRVTPDEKFIVSGNGKMGGDSELVLVRYLADGSLDPSFQGGIVYTDFGGADDFLHHIALQADGRIVGVGRSDDTGGDGFHALVVRFFGDPYPEFSLSTDLKEIEFCPSETPQIALKVFNLGGFNDPIHLSVAGLPPGAEAIFSPSDTTIGNADIQVALHFAGVAAGRYPLSLHATSGSINRSLPIVATLRESQPNIPLVISPLDGSSSFDLELDLEWFSNSTEAKHYLEIANKPNFGTSILIQEDLMETSFTFTAPQAEVYYWRVRSTNFCGSSETSIQAFQIQSIECQQKDTIYPLLLLNNVPLNLENAAAKTITTQDLMASSTDSNPEEISFTLRSLPSHGQLLLATTALEVGSTFTQKDIDDQALSYVHNGTSTLLDSFQFDLINPSCSWLPNQSFHIVIEAGEFRLSAMVEQEVSCADASDGQIRAELNGGTFPYSYSLNGISFQDSPVFSMLSAGNYQVYGKDGLGQEITSDTLRLIAPEELRFNINIDGYDASIEPRGGTPPYQYRLDNQAFQNDSVFTDLSVGTYLLTIQDAKACSYSMNFTILPVATSSANSNSIFQLSPNPNNGNCSLYWASPNNGTLSIEVFDLQQRQCFKDQQEKRGTVFQQTYHWEAWPAGMYLLRLRLGEEEVYQRFLIQE